MRNRQFIATFAVGALFGSAILLTFRGHDLDLLYLKLAQCLSDKAQLQEDIVKLESKLTEQHRKLRKIDIVVETAPDEFTKLAVQKELKQKLKTMIGKDMSIFERQPDIFTQLLDDRKVYINNRTDHPDQVIAIRVKLVVISETTTITVDALKDEPTIRHDAEKLP